MLKLHGLPLSNYYNIVKQSLLEKDIPFEEVPAPPSQEPTYLSCSPMGKIPCLETPDGFLSESQAILEYLEDTHPSPPLYPQDAYARAKVRELICIAELYLDAPARRHLGHMLFGAPLSREAFDEVSPQVEKGLAALKRVAKFAPWVAGEQFGYADIVLLHMIGLTIAVMQAVYQRDLLTDEPEIGQWLARMRAREHSQAVLTAQQQSLDAIRTAQA